MTKFLKVSVVAATLLVTSTFAGTLQTVPYTVAKEHIDGQAVGAISIADKIFVDTATVDGYTPTQIPQINLVNGSIKLSASSGALAVKGGEVLAVVEDVDRNGVASNGDIVIAKYANAYLGELAFTSSTGATFTNGKTYVLANVTADKEAIGAALAGANDTVAADNITLSGIAQGATSVDISVELSTTDTQTVRDTATAEVAVSQRQVTSTVTTAADGIINSDKAFTLFTAAPTNTDTVVVTVAAADKDTDAATANDDISIKLTGTKALPTGMTVAAVSDAAELGTCTIAGDRLSVTCDFTNENLLGAVGGDIAYTVTFTADGINAISNAAFTAEVAHNFDTANNIDYVMGVNPVYSGSAGAWTYSGATLKSPYLVNSAAAQSFARISNESDQEAKVYVDIYDEAGEKVSGVLLDPIAAHSSKLYLATDMIAAAKLAGGSATLASANSGRFTAVFLVTAPAANVYGAAVVKQISGADRVTPMKDNSGFAQ